MASQAILVSNAWGGVFWSSGGVCLRSRVFSSFIGFSRVFSSVIEFYRVIMCYRGFLTLIEFSRVLWNFLDVFSRNIGNKWLRLERECMFWVKHRARAHVLSKTSSESVTFSSKCGWDSSESSSFLEQSKSRNARKLRILSVPVDLARICLYRYILRVCIYMLV